MYTIIRHGEQSSIPSKLFSKVQFSSVCLFNSHKSVCFYLVFNILKMCCILIHFFSFSKSHRLRYLNKHITSRRICFVYSYSGRQLYAPTYFFCLSTSWGAPIELLHYSQAPQHKSLRLTVFTLFHHFADNR